MLNSQASSRDVGVLVGLEGLVVDDLRGRERHAALRADADRVAREVVLADDLLAAREDPVVEVVEVGVGVVGEHLEQVRARGGHAERVPVVGADLVDGAVLDDAHDLLVAADRAGRHAAAERLGERDHVRHHAEALGRAAGGDAEAGLDLVEDQHDAVAGADLAHLGQVAVLGEHDPEVHHRRLHDHAGGLAALGVEALDAALHRAGVVERHGDRHVDGRLRDARAVGQRGEVLAVADLVVLDPIETITVSWWPW